MGTVTLSPIERGIAPGGLLRSAGSIPASPSPWGGITFTPDCGQAGTWDCASAGEKTFNALGDPVRFDSWIAYSAHRCYGRPVEEILSLLARNDLDRNLSQVVARELQLSTRVASNPSLNSEAYDITFQDGGGTASTLCAGVGALLSGAADCGNVDLIIHAPRVALPALLSNSIATFNFDTGQYYIGAHKLVVDDYSQVGPGAVAAADEAWLYATGPIEVAKGSVEVISYYHSQTNEMNVLAEQAIIHRFDPCCVYAILVELC